MWFIVDEVYVDLIFLISFVLIGGIEGFIFFWFFGKFFGLVGFCLGVMIVLVKV